MSVDPETLTLRQRFFQRKQKRISVRLEEEFWRQLEACAALDGINLTDLVFDIASGGDESANRSSALRTYCVQRLGQAIEKARLAASNVDVQTLLTACPTPCVVLTPDRKIAAHNTAFYESVLKPVIEKSAADHGEANLRFTISRPLGQIVNATLESPQGFTEANVAFYSGNVMHQMLGRFCLLNRRAQKASPILCYLRKL